MKNDSGLREEMFGGSSYGRGADHWENYHRGADAGSSEVYSHSNHGDVGHPVRRGRERMQRWENRFVPRSVPVTFPQPSFPVLG